MRERAEERGDVVSVSQRDVTRREARGMSRPASAVRKIRVDSIIV